MDNSSCPQAAFPLDGMQAEHGFNPPTSLGVTKRERFELEICARCYWRKPDWTAKPWSIYRSLSRIC